MDITFEERIIQDANGFYCCQVRFLPLPDWMEDEGWRTTYVTPIYENALKRAPGAKVVKR